MPSSRRRVICQVSDAAQQLAAADPAGVRKVGDALAAKSRENESTVARAAGQLSSRPLGSKQSKGEAFPGGGK